MVLRRIDGSLNFSRNWTAYKEGFGFPSREFWLGNEKLSFMLHQKTYELRIDVLTAEGHSCYFYYDHFRISDEWLHYKFIGLGQYNGTSGKF